MRNISIAAGLVLVCAAGVARGGVIFNAQNRFAKYWTHDTFIGDTYSTNATAPDFGPFSVINGAFATYYGVSQVSTIGPNSFDAKGHAQPTVPLSGGGQNHTSYNADSHYEVTFTLDTTTPYQLTLGPRPPGTDPTLGPTYANISLIGPGAQTTTFQTFNIYEYDPKHFFGTLNPGQYTFIADAAYSSSNINNSFPTTFDVVYDVSFQLPEPTAATMLALASVLALRRRRVNRS